jgi:hypothetical protein
MIFLVFSLGVSRELVNAIYEPKGLSEEDDDTYSMTIYYYYIYCYFLDCLLFFLYVTFYYYYYYCCVYYYVPLLVPSYLDWEADLFFFSSTISSMEASI